MGKKKSRNGQAKKVDQTVNDTPDREESVTPEDAGSGDSPAETPTAEDKEVEAEQGTPLAGAIAEAPGAFPSEEHEEPAEADEVADVEITGEEDNHKENIDDQSVSNDAPFPNEQESDNAEAKTSAPTSVSEAEVNKAPAEDDQPEEPSADKHEANPETDDDTEDPETKIATAKPSMDLRVATEMAEDDTQARDEGETRSTRPSNIAIPPPMIRESSQSTIKKISINQDDLSPRAPLSAATGDISPSADVATPTVEHPSELPSFGKLSISTRHSPTSPRFNRRPSIADRRRSSSISAASAASTASSRARSESLASVKSVLSEELDEFDEFAEAGEGDDDFGDFEAGEAFDTFVAPAEPQVPSIYIPNLTDQADANAVQKEIAPLLDLISPRPPTEVPPPPPLPSAPSNDAPLLLTERSLSLWKQLTAPPPLQPPDWKRSRIKRLFLVSLGVPVDLDEILPQETKLKKLVLPSLRSNAVDGSKDRTGSQSEGNGAANFDVQAARQLAATSSAAVENMSEDELRAHVKRLEAVAQEANEVITQWLAKREAVMSDKETFEAVIENLVGHAQRTRRNRASILGAFRSGTPPTKKKSK
ncbi:hypothetical protein SAICODRAFT_18816 [Saitoella complicata NRRL Y-17804]|uniref:Uncharacterized protein n=1 Tax=Saitoella complicata (strain BCRC 22490 / CBS 7301 / JCM 7358 / NBRC 10748 / NRRL Y-17804) TaxID=698492 RepID=A0A0E9NG74_SAICN|nr:uncharacterized protein SAICODRAFT_18816 [Saitoella complicata NRRL Y-17804]ODQ53316.1 hypothetical protein SAICODRAFT_18816 [Saitoella complicata NRRL Y-17804]GAO48854.1 hypothetical protein G7K_3020-t1 [Saitoella complicata NRRL Y-17804]